MIDGSNVVAGRPSALGGDTFRSVNPRTGEEGAVAFHDATAEEIVAACAAAEAAFDIAVDRPMISGLLGGMAAELEALGDELISTAEAETALGAERLTGERTRTAGQLRAFAALVESGEHLGVIVAGATETTPDVRRMLVPIGPVAVFGASNFPLAFSVPGGDTASALAAGCPVVAKGHPSHPATSELCARAISKAVDRAGLPVGMFSMVQGTSPDVGRAMVLAPQIRAVGFTGSHRAGRTLYELGATRPSPIPVYAEMGSLNPVFVSEAALAARGPQIAKELAGSITLSHGQFCTKPGLVFVPDTDEGQSFTEDVTAQISGVGSSPLLNANIADAFHSTVESTSGHADVELLTGDESREASTKSLWSAPALLVAGIDAFLGDEALLAEHFGPAAAVVRCPEARMIEAARRIDGSLTATVHAEPGADDELMQGLLPELARRAGRIVFRGVPTGVAVVGSMMHGGPYPATTFPAHTSVGLTAIARWLRPVAFQNAPGQWLPPELRVER